MLLICHRVSRGGCGLFDSVAVWSVTFTYIVDGVRRQRQREAQRGPEGALVHVAPRHQPAAAQGRHEALAALFGLALQLRQVLYKAKRGLISKWL